MTSARESIELGKMLVGLSNHVNNIIIETPENDNVLVNINVVDYGQDTEQVGANFIGESMYDAVKTAYLDRVCGYGEAMGTHIVLPEVLMNDLYEIADADGVPLDELIEDICINYMAQLEDDPCFGCNDDSTDCEHYNPCDGCEEDCDCCAYEYNDDREGCDCEKSAEDIEREQILAEVAEWEAEYTQTIPIEMMRGYRDMIKNMLGK